MGLVITITTLYFDRGKGLETILEQFIETEEIRMVGLKFKSALSAEHQTKKKIGSLTCTLPRGIKITSQFMKESDVKSFWENYEAYQHDAALLGNGGVFDRGSCEQVYLLDKITNTVAEFGLVPKKDRIYTPEYKNLGIKALNPNYQVSLELTGTLYILEDKDKLKKWKTMPRGDFTKPQLEKYLPGVCTAVKMRTCIRERIAIMIDKERSCDVP